MFTLAKSLNSLLAMMNIYTNYGLDILLSFNPKKIG